MLLYLLKFNLDVKVKPAVAKMILIMIVVRHNYDEFLISEPNNQNLAIFTDIFLAAFFIKGNIEEVCSSVLPAMTPH